MPCAAQQILYSFQEELAAYADSDPSALEAMSMRSIIPNFTVGVGTWTSIIVLIHHSDRVSMQTSHFI